MASSSNNSVSSQILQHLSPHDISQITSRVFIGNGLTANNHLLLYSYNITSIVNASTEVRNSLFPNIKYVRVPVADVPSAHISDFFDAVSDHIHSVDIRQGKTLIHCIAGMSRSPTLCLAYLMKHHGMSLVDAHGWVKSCRPGIRPNNGFWQQLIRYEFELFSKNTVRMVDSPLGMIPDLM
ncbi:dual specificity protein phosphatase 21 [Ctenodactylus gundi]